MMIPERLRDQMALRDLSQSELARRVGVTQATIFKLLIGESYGTKHLHKIARELGTTPAYLTGETDDPEADAPEIELSFEERHLIESFHILDRADRSALIRIVDAMARSAAVASGAPAGATIHDRRPAYAAEGAGDR
jgi:transcriptional regulator with XRE-family HTH domain